MRGFLHGIWLALLGGRNRKPRPGTQVRGQPSNVYRDRWEALEAHAELCEKSSGAETAKYGRALVGAMSGVAHQFPDG